jgi:spore maturation protein CgeB
MRVLYVGVLGPIGTSTHRRLAIERLGHEVIEFDTLPFYNRGGAFLSGLRLRTLVGITVRDFNQSLLALASRTRPEVIWFDKPLYLWPETVKQLRALGAVTIHFTIDNPFGPRQDPGWRHILAAIPEFDLNLVQRDCNLVDFKNAGARDVLVMRTAYEPTLHFPPPSRWSDADRRYDVIFIGAPYDQRPEFMIQLWQIHGIQVRLWGSPNWDRALPPEPKALLWQGHELWNADYRETIWRARICLAFVTHSNCDDVAHKSFEIAASGGFLLAEDTPGHREHFEDGQDAVFFRSVDDCAAKIRRYLNDEPSRARVAAAGCARAQSGGYSNDERIRHVFRYIESSRASKAS